MRRRTSQGGLIELRGDRGRALEDSKRLRSNHCGAQGSWVEYEEDRLVGAPQNTTSTSGLSVPGRPPEAGVSASDEIATGEERLLRYHCGSAPEEASDDGVSSDAQSPVRMLGESENLEAGTNR